MQYLVATYWVWFIVALLAGGVVAYSLPGRLSRRLSRRRTSEGGGRHVLLWGAAAFLLGLAAAVLNWLPERDGLHLAPLLLLSFGFALGGVLGGWLRAAALRRELARAVLVSNAQSDSAELGARAKAAVWSVQDAAASNSAIEDARLDVEAKAAEVVRLAAKAAEAKVSEVKASEEERLAVEAKAAEETRIAAAKASEGSRPAADAEGAEEARIVAATRAVQRFAAEAKAAEEARLAAAAKAAEKMAAEKMARKEEAAEREAAEKKPAEEPAVAVTAAKAGEVHPGSRPQGIAPAEGEADDLKLIKGIGPKNEAACNALGIYQFRQIADWTADEAIWVGHHMASPGRIEREHWIAQARLLASGGETEHSRAVTSGAAVVDEEADAPLDPAAAEMLGKSLPEQAAAVDGNHPGRRPYGFATALGKADNLKRIRGIGPQNEGRLHGLGIWHFSQIAGWNDDNVKWVGSYLASSGRIQRDKWVAQARDLAAGKETELSRRAVAGKVAPSKDGGSDNVPALK
jgi:predicted flap endonuclease-1-like 5' DNA nuclease